MKTLIAALAVALCASAHGQLLIYKNKITWTETGGGFCTTTATTGWTVFDFSDKSFTRVDVIPKQKVFKIRTLDKYHSTLTTGPGKEYTVFSQAAEYTDAAGHLVNDAEFSKGLNSLVDIGVFTNPLQAPPKYRVPKTLQFVGRTIYTRSDGSTALQEGTGTLTLDLAETKGSNFPQTTLADWLKMVRLDLMGYTEIK